MSVSARSRADQGQTGEQPQTGGPARVQRKVRLGYVVSDKMDKTVVVRVTELKRHRLYTKTIRRQTTFKAHDESNSAGLGDLVRLMETRPISKDKRWRVVEIVEKAK